MIGSKVIMYDIYKLLPLTNVIYHVATFKKYQEAITFINLYNDLRNGEKLILRVYNGLDNACHTEVSNNEYFKIYK